MTDRDQILSRIRGLQLDGVPCPDIPVFHSDSVGDVKVFTEVLKKSGARVIELENETPESYINREFSEGGMICSALPGVLNATSVGQLNAGTDLSDLGVAVLRADFGVCENGAMWIRGEDLAVPVLPFIARQLVLVVSRQNLVADMHAAYRRINPRERPFGVFIAGPSKTADIEQSLVIGAHGPLGLTVLVVN